jgi:hypothetical protein
MWLAPGQRVRCNKWREFQRVFSTGEKEKRYIREIIFGKKRQIRYWQVTNNKETLPKNSTWYIMKKHPWWDEGKGWKNILNNLRLFIQPLCYFNLLKPWLIIEFKPQIIRLFCRLFFQLNQLINSLLEKTFPHNFYFSSA